jgi:hypothetical protein
MTFGEYKFGIADVNIVNVAAMANELKKLMEIYKINTDIIPDDCVNNFLTNADIKERSELVKRLHITIADISVVLIMEFATNSIMSAAKNKSYKLIDDIGEHISRVSISPDDAVNGIAESKDFIKTLIRDNRD